MKLSTFKNPSSEIYLLIKELENVKENKVQFKK
jgi:hypothetical protein